MKLRYKQLFNIALTPAYYSDNRPHDDLLIEPTRYCEKQMTRYKLLKKKTFGGISLLYQCSPFTTDSTPFRPINTVEKFTFKVTTANADFWYYADVNNWQKDKIYLLKNPVFNTPGNINVHSGPLNAPILFRPKEFKYEVQLDNVPGLLQALDATGNILRTIIVRAKTAAEPIGKKEEFFINLRNFADDSYTIRHINSGGNTDELVYCSIDYSPDALAIIEISYQTGLAWTGVLPIQRYGINISSRSTVWFFDVHIRKQIVPLFVASDLSIKHLPVPPEPLRTFSVVGVADDLNGFVQFKSNLPVTYRQKPMHLQLLRSPATSVLDPLPLPTSITMQKDAVTNILFTKIVVNV